MSMINLWKRYRSAILCLAAVAALALLTMVTSRPQTLATGAWGLSFQKKGEPPVGNANQQTLAEYDAAFLGDTSGNTIYLTFDAGYENGCTAQILDVLKAHNAPAAFFVVGTYVENNPELVCRMADEGHIVGNHTQHHYDMSKIADEAVFREELDSVASRYREITGREMPKYYRPPQGIYSEENLKAAQKLGYKTVFWSLAYVDWLQNKQPTAEEAFSKLIPRIHGGAVVLLHSTSTTNASILDSLLTRWEDMGYRFGTLDDLFAGFASR
ncbi:MAG: polysaccharide deacetylase family protein [Oscillospiraceae bacterium]|nr:polysaccharide deacetylase family protein [Oscillospiraceae bacterium]